MLNITNHKGNVNQNHDEMLSHTCQNGYYQRQETTSVGKDVDKRELSYTVGTQLGAAAAENMEFPQKELPYDPAIPLLGIYSKKMKTLI